MHPFQLFRQLSADSDAASFAAGNARQVDVLREQHHAFGFVSDAASAEARNTAERSLSSAATSRTDKAAETVLSLPSSERRRDVTHIFAMSGDDSRDEIGFGNENAIAGEGRAGSIHPFAMCGVFSVLSFADTGADGRDAPSMDSSAVTVRTPSSEDRTKVRADRESHDTKVSLRGQGQGDAHGYQHDGIDHFFAAVESYTCADDIGDDILYERRSQDGWNDRSITVKEAFDLADAETLGGIAVIRESCSFSCSDSASIAETEYESFVEDSQVECSRYGFYRSGVDGKGDIDDAMLLVKRATSGNTRVRDSQEADLDVHASSDGRGDTDSDLHGHRFDRRRLCPSDGTAYVSPRLMLDSTIEVNRTRSLVSFSSVSSASTFETAVIGPASSAGRGAGGVGGDRRSSARDGSLTVPNGKDGDTYSVYSTNVHEAVAELLLLPEEGEELDLAVAPLPSSTRKKRGGLKGLFRSMSYSGKKR